MTAPSAGSSGAQSRLIGRGVTRPPEAPDSLRELAFLDRINEVAPADQLAGAPRLPRLYDEDYAILALLDRAGLATAGLIGRAALPGRAPRTVADRLIKLYRHGLIADTPRGCASTHATTARRPCCIRSPAEGSRSPKPDSHGQRSLPSANGARSSKVAPCASPTTCTPSAGPSSCTTPSGMWRPTTGVPPATRPAATQSPKLAQASAATRSRSTRSPSPTAKRSSTSRLKTFTEIKPDLSLELHIASMPLSFDLLVELDLTARPSYNRDKLLSYDAFLCGWSLAHRRYQTQGTRPAVIFVCPDARTTLSLAQRPTKP